MEYITHILYGLTQLMFIAYTVLVPATVLEISNILEVASLPITDVIVLYDTPNCVHISCI